jgi:hypothetical protein
MRSNLYLGLVHHPVYDKRKETVATAVTNFDIHDIARCGKTYGVEGFYIITPLESQIELVKRLIHHWVEGGGAAYNPTRKEALSLVRVSRTIDEAAREISELWKKRVTLVVTSATRHPKNIGMADFRQALGDLNNPFLMLFGTGWGVTEEVKARCDHVLEPIEGKGYNHLSVRSAVAILLDRLLGNRNP